MAEFQIPTFLLNHSTDDIHNMMIKALPADLDVSEGSHTWNLTRPTALVGAELCEFVLPEVIKLIFPEFSYGIYLDYHAVTRGMQRRPAAYASGYITITGTPNTVIPAGSLFSTAQINDEPSVDYKTLDEITIPAEGTIKAAVQCTQAGLIGNTGINTIIIKGNRLTEVKAVTNEEVITGGTEIEDDETLIERIVEYDRTQGESFVGSIADYKRWALSVEGVGSVVIIPAPDTDGLVTIVVTDMNGDPAQPKLLEDVYNYIMLPDEPAARRAPVNAYLSVIAPEIIGLGVKATVELDTGYTMAFVMEEFQKLCTMYMPTAMDEGEVKWTQIAKLLASVEGVNDFDDLQIGVAEEGVYGTDNIPISNRQLPRVYTENIVFTAGTV